MTDKKISKINASPKARKFARELGASLDLIQGSQREGRINEDDIRTYVKETINAQNTATSLALLE